MMIIINKFDKSSLNFISKENWSITFTKSLLPSIIIFAISFFLTFIISFLVLQLLKLFLPSNELIKDWITAPNQGTIDLLNKLIDEDYLTVIIYFTYIVIFIPVFEEICFRGFLQEAIGKYFNENNLDIIFVSLIFSFFHMFSFSNGIFAFIAGYFLSRQRKNSGSINQSIFIHSIINFTLLLSGIIFFYLTEFKKK